MQSARSKGDDLILCVNTIETRFTMLILTETWYGNNDDVLAHPGYSKFALNRDYITGAGLLSRSNFSGFVVLNDYSIVTPNYEILSIKRSRYIYFVLHQSPNDQCVFRDTNERSTLFIRVLLSFVSLNAH